MGLFARSPALEEVVFWAVDLETTGLGRGDEIVALAALPIRRGAIAYGERYHSLVRPSDPGRAAGEGLRAHHILPSQLAAAPSLGEVLAELDARLRTGALLLHFARLDLGFLRRAYRRVARRWPAPAVVDTVALLARLQHRLEHIEAHAAPLPTRLPDARAYLGLPAYPDHDALCDALATAELFLALRARLGARRLRDVSI